MSVDYLVHPVEVFADVARVLRPGGLFVVHVLQPLLPDQGDHAAGWPTTTVATWRSCDTYFELAAGFGPPHAGHRNPDRPVTRCTPCGRPRRPDDPLGRRVGAEVVACRALPAAGRVARAGRRREAGGVPRRDATGAGRCPGSATRTARIVVLGLAPAAHGANRTGRVFTGDRSGDWLFGRCTGPAWRTSRHRSHAGDGLRLHDAWVTARVKCAPPANAPTPAERDACAPFLRRELDALRPAVVVCLGAFGYARRLPALRRAAAAAVRPRRRGRAGEPGAAGSFHPSQQNTFTGRLTEAMLDAVFDRAVALTAR